MTWKKVLNIIFVILLLVALIFCGYSFYQLTHQDAPEVVYLTDTITITKDSLITKLKYKTKFDTIREIQYIDTIHHDTIKLQDTIEIPIEHRVDSFTIKNDSLTVTERIHYSGFKAQVDSVEMTYDWQYTFQPQKQKKFGWCITFGPSINYSITLDTKDKTWSSGPSAGFSIVIGPSYIIK